MSEPHRQSLACRGWALGTILCLLAMTARCTLVVDSEGLAEGERPPAADASDASDAASDRTLLPDGATVWEGNGHTYFVVVVPAGVRWEDARREAEAMGGHLATVTSPEENQFVHALAAANAEVWATGRYGGPWLGGFQPPGSPEPGGGWRWVTDEPWSFTNWAPSEPSDSGEDYLQYDRRGNTTWNDNDIAGSFVVEVE